MTHDMSKRVSCDDIVGKKIENVFKSPATVENGFAFQRCFVLVNELWIEVNEVGVDKPEDLKTV